METTTSQTSHPATLLHRSIAANAAFSIASGLGLALFSAPLGRFADLPTLLIAAVGVGVTLFGLSLALPLRRGGATRELGTSAVVADIGWVAGAAVLLAFPDAMSTGGRSLLAALTVVVAGFAAAEWIGLRRASG